ncbi:MAG: hypothetical protein DRQ48_09330, partial [Gammaproteobacteria bacterium]
KSTLSISSGTFRGNIAQRNEEIGHNQDTTVFIIGLLVNDVSVTVLPDAPIDDVTGLPIPTIAVATNGGVSVIHNNGTIVDFSYFNPSYDIYSYMVEISNDGLFYGSRGNVDPDSGNSYLFYYRDIYNSTLDTPDYFYTNKNAGLGTAFDKLAFRINVKSRVYSFIKSNYLYMGFNSLLAVINENKADPTNGMTNYITKDYQSGWQYGDIKGAYLASTDSTDLVASGELITNGTFDTDADWTKGTGWFISSGIASSDGSQISNSLLTQSISIPIINIKHTLSFDVTNNTSGFVALQFDNVVYSDYRTQSIATSGAYSWEFFTIGTDHYLAVANYYNGSTYNINSVIYKWNTGTLQFDSYQSIATNGAIDWKFFTISGDYYLAVANYYNGTIRNLNSVIYKWNTGTLQFDSYQSIATSGAYDWNFFTIGSDHYLAISNNYNDTTRNINSVIYKWNTGTTQFDSYQSIATSGSRDWELFIIGSDYYLAVANSYNGSTYNINSVIYKWNTSTLQFDSYQSIATNCASDWKFFTIGTDHYLVVANNYNDSTYNVNSVIYKWNTGTLQFDSYQSIATIGASDWKNFTIGSDHYLAVANYYNGTTRNVNSVIYKWNTGTLQFDVFQSIATSGAINWEFFTIGTDHYLAVANNNNDSTRNIQSPIYKWNTSTEQFDDALLSNYSVSKVINVTNSNPNIDFIATSNFIGNIDNVSLKAVGDYDRSINNKGLEIKGTITRSPVATGSELIAYSGFVDNTNYLIQSHNDDFNFGTGEFHIMGWVKGVSQGVTNYLFDRSPGTNNTRFALLFNADGFPHLYTVVTASITVSNFIPSDFGDLSTRSDWFFIGARRHADGSMSITIDDKTVTSSVLTLRNIDSSAAFTTVGVGFSLNAPMAGSMSLLRIGAGAPSDDQLKEIYESEKKLFQENAACTLSSTTDSAVNALAYDDDTELLHVAGTDNLDTFDGLVRVDSEVGAYTSLSANNGVIAKGN